MENYDNLFEQQPEQTEQPFDREAWRSRSGSSGRSFTA